MKITALLLLAFVMSVSAGTYGQKINLNRKNVPLKTVFLEIKRQSGYDFIYDEALIRIAKPVTLSLKNADLPEALDQCLENQELMYVINDKIVVVKEKPETGVLLRAFTLTGLVTDAKNEPLPGVVVANTTTKRSVATNAEGRFSITAEKGDIIHFRMIGFEEKVIVAGDAGTNNVTIVLQQTSVTLQTTVVTALGIQREERALGYSVSVVDGEGLKKARETNVINSLAGTVPGLVINSTAGGPAGSSRVIIRGNTTVTGNNQPLYVVDGIPIDNSNYGGTGSGMYAQGYDFGDAISAINPDDIDKISVLKGPSASALYGARAANGVILITTKKGKNGGGLGIEFNSTTSFENQLTSYDGYQYEYGQGRNQTINTSADQARTSLFSNFGARLDPDLQVISYDGVYRPYRKAGDNIGGFFRTGLTATNTVSFNSATENSALRLSATDLRNNDIIPESGLRRNSFTLNGTSKFGNLSVEARAFYMNESVDNRPALADDPGNIGNAFIGLANNVDQAWFADTYKNPDGSYIEWGGGQYRLNPYWVINEMKNTTGKNRFLGGLQLNYKITGWLNIQGRGSTDLTYIEFEKFSPRTTPSFITGALDQINQKHVTTEADVLITAEKRFASSLYLAARLGGSISRVHNKADNMQFTNLTVPDAITPASFTDKNIVESPYKKHLNSVYGLFSAGYKSYLYVDATVRQDSYSTLAKSYVYPSLSSSFVFSDAFKIDHKVLSMGKLRAAVSEVASDTDPYLLDLYYNVNPLAFNGLSYGGLSTDVMANKDLKPTRTRSWEIGTELKFLDNRLGLDLTYYNQRSRDQINRVPVPLSSGFNAQTINAGVVTNKGLEAMLSATPVGRKNIEWNISVNFARNINKVESLADGVPFLTLSEARWMGVAVIAKPDEDYGSILAYDYQKDPDGNIILDPTTLLPLQSTERQVVGKGIFNWTGGMTNAVRYKNFRLTALIDVKQGADLFSMTNLFAASRGSLKATLEGRAEWIQSEEARQAGGYTAEQWAAMGNVKGLVPKGVVMDGNGQYIQNTRAVDPSVYWPQILASGGVARPYIYDGSYVKMRELTFGYTVPQKWSLRYGIRDLQIAFVSRNPFIIYKDVPNVDPDSNYNNGNGQGLEYGSLPTRRSFGFNLNFRF